MENKTKMKGDEKIALFNKMTIIDRKNPKLFIERISNRS